MSIFKETLKGKKTSTPVWLMRQAGRHLPEYRETRSKFNNLMEMFLDPKEVAKVTLQPVKRYDLDAAIIFSDILMVLHTLQATISFNENGKGPRVKMDLNAKQKIKRAEPVFVGIEIVKSKTNIPLIGFAGGPWTTALYCLFDPDERKKNIKEAVKEKEKKIDQLIKRITAATIEYSLKQINAGIDAFQLFESWAGILNNEQFEKWCLDPATEIFKEVQKRNVPTIGFPRGASVENQINYSNMKNISCISLDYSFPLNQIGQLNQSISYQGNLHPKTLSEGGENQIIEINKILEAFKALPHVFNLGHGVLPETPTRHIEQMIKQVRTS